MVTSGDTRGDRSRWKALSATTLGWPFDGYENFELVFVAAIAVGQLLPSCGARAGGR